MLSVAAVAPSEVRLRTIFAIGLGPVETQYLRLLAEGDSRLNVLASRLGLPARTVAQVVEPFLLRSNLIAKDDEQTMRDIHVELTDLNQEAVELAAKIQKNFEEMGI